MQVAILRCSRCEDEWDVPDPDVDELRDRCRECGAELDVEFVEVA